MGARNHAEGDLKGQGARRDFYSGGQGCPKVKSFCCQSLQCHIGEVGQGYNHEPSWPANWVHWHKFQSNRKLLISLFLYWKIEANVSAKTSLFSTNTSLDVCIFPMSAASRCHKHLPEQTHLEEQTPGFLLEDTLSSAKMSEHIWWPVLLLES